MNIEIANRLVNLRKSNNYSQEALAEKLGISRQAVSKWERAEASPDTDNLILLARLYGVSLDELLSTEDEIPCPESREEANGGEPDDTKEDNSREDGRTNKDEFVDISLSGVHVRDKDGSEVHVGWNGIHVDDRKGNNNVDIDGKGVYVNGEKYDKNWIYQHERHKFPVMLLIVIAYLLIGVFFNLWHPGWILLLLIPVWSSFVEAIYKKNAHEFAYPVVATIIFLLIGFFYGDWHPGWVVFLTIPLYYSMVGYIRWHIKERKRKREEHQKVGGTDEL